MIRLSLKLRSECKWSKRACCHTKGTSDDLLKLVNTNVDNINKCNEGNLLIFY